MTQPSRPWTSGTADRFLVDTTPWLSCDDCFRHVDAYVEALLSDPTTTMPAMDAHLRGCPACAEEAEALLELAAADAGIDPAPALAHLGRPSG